MRIKQYDMYAERDRYYNVLHKKIPITFYYITFFLTTWFSSIKRRKTSQYIANLQILENVLMIFEDLIVSVDNKEKIVYISEGYYMYDGKPTTPEIEKLLDEEDFIELCKIGFLEYNIMSKDNFISLLLSWDKITDDLSPFAMLYQDDQDLFHVVPFQTQQAMEQFLAEHIEPKVEIQE